MYVVGFNKKALRIGPGDVRQSGEPVPEAESWKGNVLQSHLSLKWLQTREEWEYLKAAEDRRLEARAKAKAKKKELTPHQPEPEPEEKEEEDVKPKALSEYSRSELRRLAKHKGLTIGGSKDALIERIEQASK